MQGSRSASTQGHRERILVVDDNPDAADSLAVLLEFLNYETRAAYDGAQAIEAAMMFRPDLVILDINMPVMNGYQAAKLLRRSMHDPRVILVALTGRADDDDKAAARSAGFDEHLEKPLAFDDLDEVVARVFREHPG